MDDEARLAKALADGAELLVRQIEQCERSARQCIEVAWTNRDVTTEGRSACMGQAYQFIRLASELGTALAKLKDQRHHQHIAVERLDGGGIGGAHTITMDRAIPVAPEGCTQETGEGEEGVDKQLDGAESAHAAAS